MRHKDLAIKQIEILNRGKVEQLAGLNHDVVINYQITNKPIIWKAAIKEMFFDPFSQADMTCIVENIFEDKDWAILEQKAPLGIMAMWVFI